MAKLKSNGNGGTNGDGGAPAEVSATDAAPAAPVAETPPDPATGGAEQTAADIPPDQQAQALDTAASETLKLDWLAIDAMERELARHLARKAAIEHVLATRAIAARTAATGKAKGAKVKIGGRDYKPRERPEKHGGGYALSIIDDSAADV